MRHERWNLGRLGRKASGSREGWWGVAPGAEAFLDQLVMWRELGFNTCAKRPGDYWRFESLPDWAQRTLTEHAEDPRQYTCDFNVLESAKTHDPLWNAAQREMLREGWMHNYLRMLWGKRSRSGRRRASGLRNGPFDELGECGAEAAGLALSRLELSF